METNFTTDKYEHYLEYKQGDVILLKGNNDYFSYKSDESSWQTHLHFSGLGNISGNIMSILYGDDFVGKTELPSKNCFEELFVGWYDFKEEIVVPTLCCEIANAQNLILPSTTLTEYCYGCMFEDCGQLTQAPKLPATALATECYYNMFDGCECLKQAPELPATELAQSCYGYMFDGCKSLECAPELPATTLAQSCYEHMFRDCTSLKEIHELPCTKLEESCYANMFYGCNSLVNAPKLPASNLSKRCYYGMFLFCSSLVNAPILSATQLADYCYSTMFSGCSSLKIKENTTEGHLIFECPTLTGINNPVGNMFSGCYSGEGYYTWTPNEGNTYSWVE